MPKQIVSKPSCFLSIIVFILLVSSIGLLVTLLKGRQFLSPETSANCKNGTNTDTVQTDQDIPQSDQGIVAPDQVNKDIQSDQASAEDDVVTGMPWRNFRLPRHVIPLHYDVRLNPDLQMNTFEGEVKIVVNVTRETRFFLLHSSEQTIHSASVANLSNQTRFLVVEKRFSYERNEFLVLELAEETSTGLHRLTVQYTGTLNPTGMLGFYRAKYINRKNETRYMATSKFQPFYARRAFPCFDEPSFKATFNVSLVHDKDYIALSNMAVESTESIPGSDLVVTKFQKSVPMVTYLTCYIVCDFHYREYIMKNGKPFRLYSEPDKINSTIFAFQTGSKILEYYEEYVGIDYSLPKMDFVAVPEYPSSATEHWGIVTFKSYRLFYDPLTDSETHKKDVVSVIGHELAHMWFGNLVTCDWWDDTWLNEGFTNWIEFKGVGHAQPDWDIESQFLTEDMHPAMRLDMTRASKTLVSNVTDHMSIPPMFSTITYKKGGSIVRMLNFFLGNEMFRKATSTFLRNRQYETATTDDLLTDLSSICGLQGERSILEIIKPWTEQLGFPYVTVKRKEANSSVFIAKQKMFLVNGEFNLQTENSTSDRVWSIPLSYTTSRGTTGMVWIHDHHEVEFSVSEESCDWVKFNINQTGYYLVNYEEVEWKKLADLLKQNHEALSPADRASLLFDAYHLAGAGHVGFDVFLDLSLYLKKETHLVPWDVATKQMSFMALERETRDLLQNYQRYLAGDLYRTLRWNISENHLENLLREKILISMMCSARDPECLADAANLYKHLKEGEKIPHWYLRKIQDYGRPPTMLDWNDEWKNLERISAQSRNRIRRDSDKQGVFFQWWIMRDQCQVLTSINEMNQRFPTITEEERLYCEEVIQSSLLWSNTYSKVIYNWLLYDTPAPWLHHRLPETVVPTHYDLILHPMLDREIFQGRVAVQVQLKRPCYYLLVHAAPELNVTAVKVTSGDESLVMDDVFRYNDHDYLVIKMVKKLPEGMYRLHFEFEGPLTVSLKGLYKSSYVDPVSNERRFLAATQFESISARKAFPCFDETRFKSTFNVSIVHSSTHYALSNTLPERTTVEKDELLMTRFEKTLPMVTYLLAVVVCDFAYKETTTDNGVRLRIYAPPHHIEKTYYALNVGSRILTYYENYFDIPFPLKKLDMITIPDFDANGMENWGLITFSEESLVCDNSSSVNAKKRVVNIIAHELAHMWFGDLVTMDWWSDLWLNEGFATYISTKGARHVEPAMNKEDEVSTDKLMAVMDTDSVFYSHPIVQDVTRVDSAIFDAITYLKGSSVLRMLENYMGEDFRIGVSAYLKKHSFGNAKTEDLWDALSNASQQGLNVSTLMSTWTNQMNYPCINVERSENGTYVIQQYRYFGMQENFELSGYTKPSVFNYVWEVPVTYRTSSSDETSYLLLNTSQKVDLVIPDSDWIKLNLGFTGFYSVNYDETIWTKFIHILKPNHTFFRPSDRLGLLHDALSLGSSGVLRYDIALNLTEYLRAEEYHPSWSLALERLKGIEEYFGEDRGTRDVIREHIRTLSNDLYKKYGWNNTGTYSERNLRKVLIGAACHSGNQDCLLTARHLFKLWKEGKEIPEETKWHALVYGQKTDVGPDSWNLMWSRYLVETDPHQKELLLKALPMVENEDILGKLLEYAQDEELVRKHNFFQLVSGIADNPKGLKLVTRFFLKHWDDLVRKYGSYDVEKYASIIFSNYKSPEDLVKVRELYNSHPKDRDSQILRLKAIENINFNINWIKRHQDNVRKWFQNHVNMPWRTNRLSKNITPILYNLTLHPNVTQNHFKGEVGIELEVSETTDHVILHRGGLEIKGVELRSLDPSAGAVEIEEELKYEMNEFYVVRFKGWVGKGLYVLKMKFVGEIPKDGKGVGRYQYVHRTTMDERYLVATQFEPIYARKVFPCFDEPDMKAKFRLSIVHDSHMTAVSNMPEDSKKALENGLTVTEFKESVKMSTYLIFFAVFDFEYLQTDYKGKQVRAYAPPDRLAEAEYGLNLTVTLLEKLEDYFDIPFSLPKLDSVSIPGYRVPGMEHWGCIAYNSDYFLVQEASNFLQMNRVITHELVHQWIGNLVTMQWWTDLWLKEGLATLVTYQTLGDIYPQVEKVGVRRMTSVMCLDSTSPGSHPIVQNASTAAEIIGNFDAISYDKAAAVLKMLQYSMKEDFQRGVKNYLKKYAYQNANSKDFWTVLSKATKKDVGVMMKTWTHRVGFPLVHLKRKGTTVTATQTEFRTLNNTGWNWTIPLVYENLRTGMERTVWLSDKKATFDMEDIQEDAAVKFNPGFSGYYLVNYDPLEWARLGRELRKNHSVFSATDRYNLLHDAFLLAETDHVPYSVPLQLSKYLHDETDPLPWSAFEDKILRLVKRVDGRTSRELLKAYVRDLTDLYEDYTLVITNKTYFQKSKDVGGCCGYTETDPNLLSNMAELSCRVSNRMCTDAMLKELNKWMKGEKIAVDLLLVFEVAIPQQGDAPLWDRLYSVMTSNDTSEDDKYLMADGLTSFDDIFLTERTLSVITKDPVIDTPLAHYMFQELAAKTNEMHLIWNYIKNNWNTLTDRFVTAKNILSPFCENFKTIKELNEMKDFVKQLPTVVEFDLEGCVKQIQNSIDWCEKYEEGIATWLNWNVNK